MGVYGNSGSYTNITIVNNFFRDCQYGIYYNPTYADNVSIANNKIELPNSNGQTVGILFYRTSPGFGSVSVKANSIRRTDNQSGANTAYGIWIDWAQNVLLVDNLIDSSFLYQFLSDTKITAQNNLDLAGVPITRFNQIGASSSLPRRAVSASATFLLSDRYVGVSSAVVTTQTLPSANARDGQELLILDEAGSADTASITVVPAVGSGQTINGAASAIINTKYGSLKLISNGGNWFKL